MYSPDSTADNLVVPNGQALGEGNLGTGAVGGVADLYRIYATWPFTANVLAPGNVKYDVSTGGDSFSSTINQDDIDGASPFAGRGSVWVLLGTINYTSGAITVDQQPDPPNSAFVSMRFDALLFERVPEPTTLALLSVGSLLMMRRRQRIASRVVDDPTG